MKKLDVKKAASELEKFEQELYADSSKNKKRKKNIVTGNEPIKQSDKANVLSDQKKNTIAKKRKSNELLINGVNKKVKRSSNEWKVESLPNSKTTLNNSATPSINGSVLDISSENVTSTPEQSKTNKNKKTKLKKAVDKSNEKILHISTDNINPTTKPPIKLENKLSKSENNLSISKKHSLLNRRTDNGKTKPIKNKLKKTNNQTNEKNIHEVNESAWDEPLKEGEIEYFVPFRKTVAQKTVVPEKEESPLKTNNPISNKRRNSLPENLNVKKKEKLLLNPFAVASSKNPLVQAETPKSKMKNQLCVTPKNLNLLNKSVTSSEKRVKIVLKRNCSQNTEDYVQQLRSSPQIPYDSEKKPLKTSLKPSVGPSRINPYYKFQDEKHK